MHIASPLTFFLGEPARPPSRGVCVPATSPHGRERMWASSLRLCIPLCPFLLGSPCCWSQAASSGEHLGTRGLDCRCPHVRKQIDVETLGLHSAQHDGQKDATQRTADLWPVSAHPECLLQADRRQGQTHIHSLCPSLCPSVSLAVSTDSLNS